MEHRKKGRKLKRTASHKKALLSNLSISLIKYKRIKTTVAKAKELRTVVEPLVTKAKKAYQARDKKPEMSVHLRREARKIVKDKDALNILFNEVAEKTLERNGGYTRILKLGARPGDSAETAIIEFVDYDVVEEAKAKEKAKAKVSKKDAKQETEQEPVSEKKEAKKKTEKKETVKKAPAKKTVKKEKEESPKKATPKKKAEPKAAKGKKKED